MSDERAREASGVARKLLRDLRNAQRSEDAFALEDVIVAEFVRRADLEAEVAHLRRALMRTRTVEEDGTATAASPPRPLSPCTSLSEVGGTRGEDGTATAQVCAGADLSDDTAGSLRLPPGEGAGATTETTTAGGGDVDQDRRCGNCQFAMVGTCSLQGHRDCDPDEPACEQWSPWPPGGDGA